MRIHFSQDGGTGLSMLEEAERILKDAVRLQRPFTQAIKDREIEIAIDHISTALEWLRGDNPPGGIPEATESATEGEEERNPYQDTVNGILSAAELLRASGALKPEFEPMREAGLHRARLMLSIALAELCE